MATGKTWKEESKFANVFAEYVHPRYWLGVIRPISTPGNAAIDNSTGRYPGCNTYECEMIPTLNQASPEHKLLQFSKGASGTPQITLHRKTRPSLSPHKQLEIGRNRVKRPAPAEVSPGIQKPLSQRKPFGGSDCLPPLRQGECRILPTCRHLVD